MVKKIILVPIIILLGVVLSGCQGGIEVLRWDDESKSKAIEWCKSLGGDGIRFEDTTEKTRGRVLSYAVCFKGFNSLGTKDIVFFAKIIKIGDT